MKTVSSFTETFINSSFCVSASLHVRRTDTPLSVCVRSDLIEGNSVKIPACEDQGMACIESGMSLSADRKLTAGIAGPDDSTKNRSEGFFLHPPKANRKPPPEDSRLYTCLFYERLKKRLDRVTCGLKFFRRLFCC